MRHFQSSRAELDSLRGIEDPIVRAAEILSARADARVLLEELDEMREQSIYELFKQIGGSKTAEVLGLSRATLYRIVWRQEPKDPDPFVQRRLELRRENHAKAVAGVVAALSAAGVRSGADLLDPNKVGKVADTSTAREA